MEKAMHRRSRCVVFREHVDPGQGEAMLGQALHEKPALRFSECSGRECCMSGAAGIYSAAAIIAHEQSC